MLLEEPRIEPSALEAIKAPTLILAGDHDLIRDEHTIEIYHHIPNSQLCIFPNATHFVPYDDPELFNSTVERFLTLRLQRRTESGTRSNHLKRREPPMTSYLRRTLLYGA